MSTDSAVSIAWDVFKTVFVPIKHRFEYVMCSKRYADGLREEVGILKYEAERVHNAAEQATNNLQNTHEWVEKFLASAEKALSEAGDLLDKFEKMSKTCCHGTLPDPICSYQFSRKAKHKIDDIKNVTLETKGKEISFSRPAPGNVAAPTPAWGEGKDVGKSTTAMASASSASTSIERRDDGVFESRASVIQKIMDALANNNISVVGVHGMGGVGKSTLLADAEKRIREKNSFNWIAKADVSQNPDIKKIQEEIAHWLGLSDIKKEENVNLRAKLLRERLGNEKKVLIILDNLWEGLDLKLVGIPCGHDNKVMGCKLLLTSRDRNVLQREMGCDSDFFLNRLGEKEATILFERIMGEKVHNDEFRPLVDEALRKCAGLPLLIVTMAKHFKYATPSEWRVALNQIGRSTNKGISAVINTTLQLSYDHLESEEAKSLLQLCVAYGVSNPSVENLVRYSYGLGIFPKDSSMKEARDGLSTLIRTLQASSLLLDNGGADGFKMHDLVRDFVAQFILRDSPLLLLKDKDMLATQLHKERLKSCTAICFPYVDMEELPQELDCPEVLIFLLFTNNESLEIPDSLFYSMRKLMILNLAGIHLAHSPSLFQFQKNLQTLCLDSCSLEDVAILGELRGLRILSLVNSRIQRLPKEIGQLVELRLLDLNYCSKLRIIEPGVLGSLIKLEELYMENGFDRWNAVDQTPRTNASLIELNYLKNLCTLHVSIPNPSVLPGDLNIEKLTKYKFQIGNFIGIYFWRWLDKYEGSRTLNLQLNLASDILQKGCIRTTLDRTDDLWLDRLNGIEQTICQLSLEGFPQLKRLHVQNSPTIRYIVKRSSLPTFETLEFLYLENLINLEKLCHNDISSKSFSALKVLRVNSCHKMEVLFPLSLVRELPQLKEIEVVSCKLMRGIVKDDDCGKVELRNLHVLKLRALPNIKNFVAVGTAPLSGTSNDQVDTQVAFFNRQQVTFPRLETLEITRLDNLGFMFFSSMIKSLVQLKKLTVSNCEKMEAIITEEDGFGMEISENLAFPMLTDLHLLWLESLTCFSRGKCSREAQSQDHVQSRATALFNREVTFPRLETLEIKGLDNLGFMFFPSMVKSFAQLKNLSVRYCEKMEAIITEEEGLGMETSETLAFPMLTDLCLDQLESLTCFSREKCSREAQSQDHVQSRSTTLFNQEVVFPRLDKLHITCLDNIVMIWDDQVAADSFPKLKSLSVEECNRLVNVVTSSILGRISGLESLEARSCGSLKVVFKFQPLNPLDGRPIAHSPLKELKLIDLPKLKCVWDKELHRQVKFQYLRSVSVDDCKSLTSLFPASIARDLMQFEELRIKIGGIVELIEKEGPEELSINVEAIEGASHELKIIFPFTSYFQHLKTLHVSSYDGLSNMFTPTIATNLVALTTLRITKCRMFTEVLSDEGGREGHVVAFNQLKYMELEGLTRLRCFSSGGYDLMFPLLEDVIVTGCFNMNFFSKGPIEAPKLRRVRVSRDDAATTWFWKEDLNITIQNMFEEMGTFAGVKKMLLSELPDLIGKWHSELNPIKSSCQLKSLTVDKCPSFIKAIPSKLMLVLDKMSELQVRDCESLEEIFDLEGLEAVESTRVLPRLRELNLVNLPKLRRLWNKDLQGSMCFNSLSGLTLYNCSNLGHAFTPSMARCLAHLWRIEIKECGQMEGVIADEEGQGSAVEKITFPNLNNLRLECLPNLTSFLLGKNHTLECPKLEELTIAHCPKMRSLTGQSLMENDHGTASLFAPQVQFPRLNSMVLSHMDNLSKIWTDGPRETLTFDYLGEVEVQNCKSLENLFPHWVATSLTQLKKLRVECCGVEEIVASGDDTPHSNTAQVLFPKLTSLVLHEMPRLKSFYPNLPTLNWPFLKELRVTHCDKVNMLSFAASINKWTQRDDQQDLSDQEAHSSFERDFPNLKRPLLVDKDIQMIQDEKLPHDILGKPKALTLACFHDEKAVFPSRFLLERFQNLQSLEVFCSFFEDIFPNEGLVDEGKHLVLENLRELRLNKLHNLKCVWREDSLTSKILHSIKTFEVWDCPCLTTLFPAAISFQNLTELVVKNSSGLVHLVTASAITNLVHLTNMTIIGCERMKEVVANDGNGEGNVISLGKLFWLILENLPSLECFSSSCIFMFPSLFYIEVEECPQMKIFSKGTLSTPKLQYASLFRYKWNGNWKGCDLNETIQKLSA